MTVALDRLLKQLEARGLSVGPGSEPGQLLLSGPTDEKTPAVMDAVKAFKPQLLDRFGRQESKADPDPEPPPTGRPPDAWVCEDHEVVRSGVCRAVRDGWLAWARYVAGRWYWFEECRLPWGPTSVVSFRVFAGSDSGFATRAKFAELFAEG